MAAVVHPSRSHIRRYSPLANANHTNALSTATQNRTRMNVSDSDSDDEPPPVIKLSKAARALLGEDSALSPPSKPEQAAEALRFNRSVSAGKAGLDTPSRAPGIRIIRKSSPSGTGDVKGTTPLRVVQVGTRGSASAKRSISIAGPYPHRHAPRRDPTPEPNGKLELVTPAPRVIRTRMRAGSNASQDDVPLSPSRPGSRAGSRSVLPYTEQQRGADTDFKHSTFASNDPVPRYAQSTIARSQSNSTEAVHPPGSQRVKRAPAVTGSLFKSKPVRRGFRRRESDDNASPNDDAQSGPASASNYTPQDRSLSASRRRSTSRGARAPSAEPISVHDYAQEGHIPNDSRPSSRQALPYAPRTQLSSGSRPGSRHGTNASTRSRETSVERYQSRQASIPSSEGPAIGSVDTRPYRSSVEQANQRPAVESKPALSRTGSFNRAQYRFAGPKIQTDAVEDQENLPPPTFRRNKDQEFKYLGKPGFSIQSDDEKPNRLVNETPVPIPAQHGERKALGTISGNTPHRPAPAPPPKMSVLDAATTTAGAGVTKSKKKRIHIVVNGKIFTQMGKIGKGGSSDVYCVMAENYKTFALKRVKLDDSDESAIRGYKGEIDLLKKLSNVDRVIRLFDWELNEDKQELTVLMEKGDTDLNRILTLRLSGSDAGCDLSFTRYHWKEMLECVQSVHEHDIVHSDLKPANFLVVQGRLKLIDFGIANAIDIDNTVNVHRDSHVGTPNYMSPESITDTNAPQPGQMSKDAAGRPLKKDMRIGKSSDVWSLGCILYQMTYGRPPFAHIANQISRIMAITNPKHVIEFPEVGIGNAYVPPALRSTLRRCLNRDPDHRPTIPDMLSDRDPFLNPDSQDAVLINEQTLGMIIQRVVDRCKDSRKEMPTNEEIAQYPRSFLAKIREKQAYA